MTLEIRFSIPARFPLSVYIIIEFGLPCVAVSVSSNCLNEESSLSSKLVSCHNSPVNCSALHWCTWLTKTRPKGSGCNLRLQLFNTCVIVIPFSMLLCSTTHSSIILFF